MNRSDEISTHTPLAGRDDVDRVRKEIMKISTHTPLAGRDKSIVGVSIVWIISTHTPLAGRDQCLPQSPAAPYHFYSHAPRGT